VSLLALIAGIHQAAAQGTAFTHQGRLYSGTNLATIDPDKFSEDFHLLFWGRLRM
jgi:hypothetical protein